MTYEKVSTIPTVMQAGYAAGLLFLNPLGDVFRRRAFVLILVWFTATVVSLKTRPASVAYLINKSVARSVHHRIISRLCCLVLYNRCHYSNTTTHATPCWGPSSTSKTRYSSFYRRFRSTPGYPCCACSLWYSHRIHVLAQHLLAFARLAISHLHPPLAFHARLPCY